jgi:hypothetical protein
MSPWCYMPDFEAYKSDFEAYMLAQIDKGYRALRLSLWLMAQLSYRSPSKTSKTPSKTSQTIWLLHLDRSNL